MLLLLLLTSFTPPAGRGEDGPATLLPRCGIPEGGSGHGDLLLEKSRRRLPVAICICTCGWTNGSFLSLSAVMSENGDDSGRSLSSRSTEPWRLDPKPETSADRRNQPSRLELRMMSSGSMGSALWLDCALGDSVRWLCR